MAEYRVEAPDGSEMVLEGPDNASDEDILKAAQELYQPKSTLSKIGDTLGDVGKAALGAGGFGLGLATGVGKEAMYGFPEGSAERIGNMAEGFAQTWENQNTADNWKAGANAITGLPGQMAAGLMATPGLAVQAIFGEDPASLKQLADDFERRASDWSWTPFKGEGVEDVQNKGSMGFQAVEEDITDNIVKAAGITDIETQNHIQGAVRYALELGLPGEVAIRHVMTRGRIKPSGRFLDHVQGIYDKIEYARKEKEAKAKQQAEYDAFQKELDDQDPQSPQYGKGDMSTPPELDGLNKEFQADMEGAHIPEMSQKATRRALREAGEGVGLGIAERPPERTRASDAMPFEPWRSPEDKMAYPTPDLIERAGRAGPERVDLAKKAEIETAAKTLYEKIQRVLHGERMASRWKQRGAIDPSIFRDRRTFKDRDQTFTMHPGEVPASIIDRVGGPVSLDFVKNERAAYVSMSIHERGKPVGYVVFKKVRDHLEAAYVKMKDGYHGANRMYDIMQGFADIHPSMDRTPAGKAMWERAEAAGKTEGGIRPMRRQASWEAVIARLEEIGRTMKDNTAESIREVRDLLPADERAATPAEAIQDIKRYYLNRHDVPEKVKRALGGTGKKGFGQGGALSWEPIRNLFEARKHRKYNQFRDEVFRKFGDAYTEQTIKTAWDLLKGDPVDPLFASYYNEQAAKTAMGQGLSDYTSAPPDAKGLEEAFKKSFVKDLEPGKIKEFMRAAASGLAYLGRITNHPLIRAGGIATQRAHFRAQARARQWFGEDTPMYKAFTELRKSSIDDRKTFLRILKENEGLKDLTDADLAQYPTKVATALKEFRAVSKSMYDALKEGNDAFGVTTRPYREGWAPGIFKGRYYVSATLDGKNAGWFWGDKKGQLKKMIPELERMYPDMKFGIVQDSLRGKWDNAQERGAVMTTLEHIMDNFDASDPKMNQIRQAIQRKLDGDPMAYVGRHGRPKKGVEGAVGFEPHKSAKKNFDNFMVNFLGYADNLAKYAEYGKMDGYIKEITDPTRFRHQAEAQAAIKAVWERNFLGKPSELGAKLNMVGDIFSALVGELPGMDANTLRKVNQVSKKAFFSILFGFFNMKFMATQILQPAQFLTATTAEIAAKLNANPLLVGKSMMKGLGDSFMSALNEQGLSKEMRDALSYAEKNGVFDPMFIEQFETFGESLINNKAVEWLTGAQLIRIVENKARKHFFIQVYHMIKEAGIKDASKAADLAANFTNEKMVNYAPQFRPLMYTTLGPVGQLLSPLTTFKHNYYSQMVQLVSEAHRSKMDPSYVIPVTLMLLSQITFAGLYGLPLVQEYETVVDILKDQGVIDRTTNAKLSDLITNPERLKSAGFTENLALTGLFNAAFGLDFQASFAAAEFVPHNIAPVVGMSYEAFKAGNKENSSGWEAVVDKLMPRGPLRYLWEERFTGADGSFYDPKKKQHPLVYRRGDKERLANLLGARTVEESAARRRNFEKEKREDIPEKMKSDLTSKIRLAFRKKDFDTVKQLAKELVQLPGGEESFQRVWKELTEGELTPLEKTARSAYNGSEQARESLLYLLGRQ